MSNGTTTWTYTYDANGMRTSRSNGTKTYNYVYNGSQLTQMTVGNDTLYFTYGVLGPSTVTWNGTTYYYALNGQGDVTGIYDADGNLVVFYYWENAWGYNPFVDGPLASTLGALNPLRYRSYVYDTETGYYYLQSRYYDPEIGRFINADAYASTGQGFIGNNMFAYCLNNPVLYSDPTGTAAGIWGWLFGDHDYGFIHRAVQAHIIATQLFQKELVLPGIGRADIYDPETHEVWEIKHGGSTLASQRARMQLAREQVNNYIALGRLENGEKLRLGHAGAFTGAFVLNCNKISYEISYTTPEDGVILYYVTKMESYEREPFAKYVPKSEREKQHVTLGIIGVGIAVPLLVYSAGGGAWNGLHTDKSLMF